MQKKERRATDDDTLGKTKLQQNTTSGTKHFLNNQMKWGGVGRGGGWGRNCTHAKKTKKHVGFVTEGREVGVR